MTTILLSLLLLNSGGFPNADQTPDPKNQCVGAVTCDSTFVVTVHRSLPPFHCRLIEREDTTRKYTSWSYEIQVFQEGSANHTQVICGKSRSPFDMMSLEEYPGIEFLDVNFDGYLDIKMFNNRAMNGVNAGYAIYLFRPQNRSFAYSEIYSGVFGGTSFNLDPAKKEIRSAGELGCMGRCWSEDTYKVQGDTLILIKSIHQDQDDDNPGGFVLIKEEMIGGKMTVVSKEKVP